MQPFAGEPRVAVVLPSGDPRLGGRRALLELEPAAFEAELGAPVEIVEEDPGGARLMLVLDGRFDGPATMGFRRDEKLLEARAADADGILEALNLLRTAVRVGGEVEATDCATVDEAIERVVLEVAETYPAFGLRGLDWPAICRRHVPLVSQARDDPLSAFQRWLAELEDGHTWVWPPLGNLPYAVRVGGGATFVRVREGSAGWEAGVRPDWRLVAIDEAEVGEGDWLARAAAPPHARPFIAGRRLLAGPVGVPRTLRAASPDGLTAIWEDAPTGLPADPLVSWRRLDGVGYLRIEAWVGGVEDALDAALDELRAFESLVLDLRGNPGGDLVLATRTRDRFLRERTALGSIRYSVGGGELSGLTDIVGEPAPAGGWDGRLVVLTDELTFSSSEDFLLGLHGLEHVTVVGRRTGGGSGRPRALRLLPGMTLTVSTALTYDREGRCVEGAGIPVDVEVAGGDDEMLEVALAVARA